MTGGSFPRVSFVTMPSDDPLADEPFGFQSRADGSIVISYRASPVTVLRGEAAATFATRMAGVGTDAVAAQQLMARATGNFRRGNERRPAR